nr:reverse transcriptase domain-containing protein [Tanacetum cinerariifolium]
MVGAGHAAYTDRFHELAWLVPHLVTPESRKIERYLYGLAPQIHGMVADSCESKPRKEQNRIKTGQKREAWRSSKKSKAITLPVCYDDDDDEERSDSLDGNIISGLPSFSAITPNEPVLSTEEPDNSLSIPDTMCDVHLVNNPTPLEAKDHFAIAINSNYDYSSSDDDSLYNENIEYIEASPHNSELVSLEVAEIVIPEDEEIEDDNLREKLLKLNLLIAKIEALKDNYTISSKFLTKSSSTFPKSCPPTDRSDFTHEEFVDELAHIISLTEYDCFYFRNLPDPSEWISSLNSGTRENLSSTTCVNLPVEDDHSPLLAYVVWIFLAYLTHLNECPMMINEKNTPILDVPLFHFYPLDQLKYGGI